jgi:class 3 adenylate cyclase
MVRSPSNTLTEKVMVDTERTSAPSNGEPPEGDLTAPLGDDARTAIRAHASPEGIVTILFTDIVESTRFRQRVGDAAAQQRMREHNAVVREQINKHGGFEVKTQGDGFMVAFSDVVAALACSVDIQTAVAEDNEQHPDEQLRVRMGLNCGQVFKEEADFFGGAVIVAARIGAMAKADQILVSDAVRVLAGLPKGIGYVRYGRRHLKGLDESYGIWSVPWNGIEPRGFTRLRGSAMFRVSALALLLVAVVAGVIGGLALARGGGGGRPVQGAAPEELSISFKTNLVAKLVSGDCKTDDMLVRGSGDGEFSGDVSGTSKSSGETILHAADDCRTGYTKIGFTLTDLKGNTASGTVEGPLNAITLLTQSADAQAKAGLGSSLAVTITSGTGAYEGATGTGTCSTVESGQILADGSVPAVLQGDCKVQLATKANPVVAPDPVVVQLAATPLKVAISETQFDPANTVGLAVVYGNTRDTPQSGLTLKVPVPEGATILASTLGEGSAASPGERTWKLPDLAPGELKRFEFRVRILGAQAATVPLTVEITGDGFSRSVASNAVSIDVTH